MGSGVGTSVENATPAGKGAGKALTIQLLGPLTISRNGVAVALPSSRKVRALLAYLALAPRPVSRSQLCDLLWDVPNDPRGELRWCLSKIRAVLDEPGRHRVETPGESVRLDLTDCFVDALEISQATRPGIDSLQAGELRRLSALFTGPFLDGLDIDRSPAFNSWLTTQDRRFRSTHVALLEHLARSASGDELLDHLDAWLALAPFDTHAHALLLQAFAGRGQIREGEEHMAATIRLFASEGLDEAPLRAIWRAARERPAARAPAEVGNPVQAAVDGNRTEALQGARRASIAVMPFVERGTGEAAPGGPADGLAYDVITRLAKLRSLFIIAQGTVFALRERRIGPEEAGRILNVDYVVSGALQRRDNRLTVSVELAETRTARIVWAEIFNHKLDDAFFVLDEIGNKIVNSIASEIETIERNRAILKPPNSLDAWEAYHRGLWHMYRFNQEDNARAQHFFRGALRLDPTFARAHAGLSFTHFQNAFQGWGTRVEEVDRAFDAAGQSLMVDDRDPAAHWAMGRALWLRGSQDQSIIELERTIDLSPNFALGHYTLSFVHSQGGNAEAAISASDLSRQLSPFDPMLFAMLGAKAMAMARLGRFEEAADWGVKAAARPNAHPHILAIAAYSLSLAGRLEEARTHMAAIRKRLPNYGLENFLTAMQFTPEGAALFRKAARRIDGE